MLEKILERHQPSAVILRAGTTNSLTSTVDVSHKKGHLDHRSFHARLGLQRCRCREDRVELERFRSLGGNHETLELFRNDRKFLVRSVQARAWTAYNARSPLASWWDGWHVARVLTNRWD